MNQEERGKIRVVCITNRHLAGDSYRAQLARIISAGPEAVILREKDLSREEYKLLAGEVLTACADAGVFCLLHYYADVAIDVGAEAVHLPMAELRVLPSGQKERFRVIGASVHSVKEAQEAQGLGAAYVTAGHIFATDCKKDIPPRGISFLREVCHAVDIPVYALGGINAENAPLCIRAGAQGVCVMSECMREDFPLRIGAYVTAREPGTVTW